MWLLPSLTLLSLWDGAGQIHVMWHVKHITLVAPPDMSIMRVWQLWSKWPLILYGFSIFCWPQRVYWLVCLAYQDWLSVLESSLTEYNLHMTCAKRYWHMTPICPTEVQRVSNMEYDTVQLCAEAAMWSATWSEAVWHDCVTTWYEKHLCAKV